MKKAFITITIIFVCIFLSATAFGDKVKVPGVAIDSDGSVSAPGVNIDSDGKVNIRDVKINPGIPGVTVDTDDDDEEDDEEGGINVEVPGVTIDSDEGGVNIKAPGVKVNTDQQ